MWKIQNVQTTTKFDLMHVYRCFGYENTSLEFKEHIFVKFMCFWPFPADSGHQWNREKSKNHQKMSKNAIFQKLIFCYVVAGNVIFGRKMTLWGPESPQKPYIDHPTSWGPNLYYIIVSESNFKKHHFSKKSIMIWMF